MQADPAGQPSPGILVALDSLILQRGPQPMASEDAQVALRRIGWMGRPIILAGPRVAGRTLPEDPRDRESWVRGTVGNQAYAVVAFDDPPEDRAAVQGDAVERWRTVKDAHQAAWLLTDRPRQVGSARQAGLKVILIGPSDPQPRDRRPDYQARDLRDAVGHLLTMDVFGDPSPTPDKVHRAGEAGQGA